MSLLRRLTSYILGNWLPLSLSLLCMVVTTSVNLYIPTLGGKAISDILEQSDLNMLIWLALQTVAFTGILGVFQYFQNYANTFFSQKVAYEIRNDVFKALQGQTFAFYNKEQTGQLMARATTDVERIRGFLGFQLTSVFSAFLLLGGVIISMVQIDWQLTLLSFSTIPLMLLSLSYFGKKTYSIIHKSREQYGMLTSVLWENLVGIRVVRSFAREDFEKKKFRKPNHDYYDTMVQATRLRSLFNPVTTFLAGLVTIIIYWYGGTQVINKSLGVDELFVFSIYAGMLTRPVSMLGSVWSSYQEMAATGGRIFNIVDTLPEVRDKPNAITLPPIEGRVVFENVSFGYDKNRLTLENVNLDVKAGETIALLGPTGSGKSTIIHLVPRFYDVTSGRILIDTYNIRDVKLKSLRSQIGIVSQQIFLFNMTVKDNIAFGKPNATMDEIVEAAKAARAHEFITGLPNGYETIIGERGVNLSGGQQQRIAIARALLMDPRILILDDSTSSVDVDTEYEIQRALHTLLRNRTAFIVTQRVSTIRNANKIVVLENGKIVEEGSHEELVKKDGAYNRIYRTLYEAQKEILTSESLPSPPSQTLTKNETSDASSKGGSE